MTDKLEKLAGKLTEKQKLAFLHVLNEHGISVESDTVLSKFFLTLQIYVSLYEKIPENINDATAWFKGVLEKVTKDFQKPVADIAQMKTEIEKLTMFADQSAKNAEMSRCNISRELARVGESMKSIKASVKDGAENAAAIVSGSMTELLSDAMRKALPLSDIREAGIAFSEAINESKHASAELRKNVKTVRRARLGTLTACFALTFIFAVLGVGCHFYFWSERRIDEARDMYIRMISGNHRIVKELAEANRELVLTYDNDGSKILGMDNATGETRNKAGIIKFK